MKLNLSLLILVSALGIAFGQKKTNNKPKPETKSEVIDVFGNADNSASKGTNTKSNYEPKNLLKFDIWQIFNGYFIINYERMLSKRFGLEIGLGPSSPSSLVEALMEFEEESYEVGPGKIGTYGSIMLKYYTSNYDAPEGFYFAIGSRYSMLKWDPLKNGSFNTQSLKSYTRKDLLKLHVGYTATWDQFVSEWYIGAGLKNTVQSIYDYNQGGTPKEINLDKESGFGYTIGYKLGIIF